MNRGFLFLREPHGDRLSQEKKLTEETMADAAALGALASRFIENDSVPWIQNALGQKIKVIYYNPVTGLLTILSKLEPGAGIPPHTHEDLEQTFVLEGSLVDDEGECTAGNFVIRAKGSRHSPVAPKGCTMLVFFLKPTAVLLKALSLHTQSTAQT
jgi:quercetin dioxygenase-like cupin family protein